MAVEHTVARSVGAPRHRRCRQGGHPFSYSGATPITGSRISEVRNARVYLEVITFQVHRMTAHAAIDDTPTQTVSNIRAESLGMWPGLAVDGDCVSIVRRVNRLSPDVDHEDSIVSPRSR